MLSDLEGASRVIYGPFFRPFFVQVTPSRSSGERVIKSPKSAGLCRAKKAPCTSAASLKYIALNRLVTVATVWTQNTNLYKLNLVFIQKGSLAEVV